MLTETAESSWQVVRCQVERGEDQRTFERTAFNVPAVVQFKESAEDFWKEKVEILTVSRNGAGFKVSRLCPPGRLVSLALPMPRALRNYDEDADLYAVSGLVQYCNPCGDDSTKYEVGLAFIGKTLPTSYRVNPKQSYRITGMRADGLWTIKECSVAYVTRKHHRYRVALPTSLTVLNAADRAIRDETTTVDISPEGVSVLSDVEARIGDKVKLLCRHIDFCGFGVVRGQSNKPDRGKCLHIYLDEDSLFPMDRILPAKPAAPAQEIVAKGDLVRYGNMHIRL